MSLEEEVQNEYNSALRWTDLVPIKGLLDYSTRAEEDDFGNEFKQGFVALALLTYNAGLFVSSVYLTYYFTKHF